MIFSNIHAISQKSVQHYIARTSRLLAMRKLSFFLTWIAVERNVRLFFIFSQNQVNYEWDPNTAWDQNAWSQPTTQNHWSQLNSQQYQIEQQYNMDTNNTKSVINKTTSSSRPIPKPPSRPVPPRPSPVDPPPSDSSPNSSSLFISESAFPTWDD